MNYVDLLAALVALWFGAQGLRKGVVREGLEAASVLCGVLTAFRLHRRYEEVASIHLGLPGELLRPALLFFIAAVLTGTGFFITSLVARSVRKRGAGVAVDEALGFCFGAVKGVLFTLLALGLVAQVPAGFVAAALEGSMVGRAVYTLLPEMYRYVYPLLQAVD